VRRTCLFLLLLSAAMLPAGCGNEPPAPGELAVTSDPDGAAILLDGQSTGQTTPHTFEELEGGAYDVSVVLDGWTAVPGLRTVDVPFGGRVRADFTLSQEVGGLTVTSTPSGAAIFLDGEPTGEVTPHTFDALVPGDYEITVELADHAAEPGARTVTVVDGDMASADFTMVLLFVPRIVLLEGFSNVFCSGCPTFNANVHFVQGEPGYGPERLLYVKWPAFLSPLDPFYNQTTTITDDRVAWYADDGSMSLPTSYADGSLLGSEGTPPDAGGLTAWVDGQPVDAPVALAIECDEDLGDVTDLSHDATIVLEAPGGVDLTGAQLHAVLIYEEVETSTEYPFGNGDTFHSVMRDHVVVADLGDLAAGEEISYPVTLVDPDPTASPFTTITPHGKQIVAWIQVSATREIVQAGSTFPLTAKSGGR
jgi:hypothetical protein